MERFKPFIGKDIIIEKVKDIENLKNYSLSCQYMPESFEEFEEIEFKMENVIIGIAILEGKIKRILIAKPDEEDPEICRALSKEELEKFLIENGDRLVKFFRSITK